MKKAILVFGCSEKAITEQAKVFQIVRKIRQVRSGGLCLRKIS
jgi:hypothetical protein